MHHFLNFPKSVQTKFDTDQDFFFTLTLHPVAQAPVLQHSPLHALSPQHLPSVQHADFVAASLLQHADLTTFAAQPVVHVPDLQHSPLHALSPQHLPLKLRFLRILRNYGLA